MVIDPKRSPASRPPYNLGGFQGRTELVSTKCNVDFFTGANGVGFLVANPTKCGPLSDRILALYTIAANTYVLGSAIPAGPLAGNALALNWATGTIGTSTSWAQSQYSYRCVAFAIYIYPMGSATAQQGEIYLFENPTHISTGQTIASVEASPYTRAIRGVQTGDPEIENVLNWHPRKCAWGNFVTSPPVTADVDLYMDDFSFLNAPTLAQAPNMGEAPIIVTISGAAGAAYHAEVHGVYECIGTAARNLKPAYMDTRGWDLISSAFATKILSGWVGTSREARIGYNHAIVSKAMKEDDVSQETEKVLRGSSMDQSHVKSESSILPFIEEVAGIAKSVAGFLL